MRDAASPKGQDLPVYRLMQLPDDLIELELDAEVLSRLPLQAGAQVSGELPVRLLGS